MRFRDLNRRDLVRAGGGLAVAAVGRVGFDRGTGSAVAAALDEPARGMVGRYIVVRSRTLADDHSAAEVFDTIRDGYVPLLRTVPGFVAYLGVADKSSNQTAFVTVFADKAGTDESTKRAGTWLQDNGYAFFEGDPFIVEGPIGVAAGRFADRDGAATPVARGSTATPVDGSATTPVAGGGLEGDYFVMRSRSLKPDRSGAELLEVVQDGFVPLVQSIPGFVAYLVVANDENRNQFGVTIFADESGADESTRRAAGFVAEEVSDFVTGDPVVIEGTIILSVTADGS
jgi:hypothetical protein